MRIAIKIIDTDFRLTYEGILRMIFDSWKQAKIQSFDRVNYFSNKNDLKEIIEHLIKPASVMYQLSDFSDFFIYRPFFDEFKDKIEVFINNEIDNLEEGIDYIVLDTDLDYQNNNPIYFLE